MRRSRHRHRLQISQPPNVKFPNLSFVIGHSPLPSVVFALIPPGLTLFIRIWFILEMRHQPFSVISPQVVDVWAYHRWALEIIRGNFWGSDVFFLRPIYPYLLALFYTLFGQSVLPVQVFQALLATVSCFLLFQITSRLFNRTVAFIAGIGFALCGVLIFYTGTLLYVELTIFFSLVTLYLLLIAETHWWRSALAGIAFGLLGICRPEMLVLLPFLILYQIKRSRKKGLQTIAFALTTIAVISTIPVRNYLIARDPVLFTAHSGINFYFGNNPAADGTWQPAKELDPGIGFSHERLKRVAKIVNGRDLPWSKASGYWIKQSLNFILSQPAQYLKLLLRKLLLFFANYEIPNNYYFETVRPFSLALKLAFVNFGIACALAILGIILSWPKRRELLPVYTFIGGYLISALLFYVLSRLRAPVLPFFFIFAAYALTRVYQFLCQRQFRRLALAVAFIALIYLGTNLIGVNRATYAAQAWTQSGNIYLEQKKAVPAINALQRALRFDPNNIVARYSLIETYAGMRRISEAEQELNQLLATTPELPATRALLHLATARIAIARRDFNTAIRHYQAALASDPQNPQTYYLLGLVYISLNDLASAEKNLLLSLSLDPNHEAAAAALAEVRRHR